ncbi:unnamed protein product [Amoebophrya sp. A25]|nr:unnamed protein product [Amoebophrya sp. A25]|eukprot:GSA25T00010282001.1
MSSLSSLFCCTSKTRRTAPPAKTCSPRQATIRWMSAATFLLLKIIVSVSCVWASENQLKYVLPFEAGAEETINDEKPTGQGLDDHPSEAYVFGRAIGAPVFGFLQKEGSTWLGSRNSTARITTRDAKTLRHTTFLSLLEQPSAYDRNQLPLGHLLVFAAGALTQMKPLGRTGERQYVPLEAEPMIQALPLLFHIVGVRARLYHAEAMRLVQERCAVLREAFGDGDGGEDGNDKVVHVTTNMGGSAMTNENKIFASSSTSSFFDNSSATSIAGASKWAYPWSPVENVEYYNASRWSHRVFLLQKLETTDQILTFQGRDKCRHEAPEHHTTTEMDNKLNKLKQEQPSRSHDGLHQRPQEDLELLEQLLAAYDEKLKKILLAGKKGITFSSLFFARNEFRARVGRLHDAFRAERTHMLVLHHLVPQLLARMSAFGILSETDDLFGGDVFSQQNDSNTACSSGKTAAAVELEDRGSSDTNLQKMIRALLRHAADSARAARRTAELRPTSQEHTAHDELQVTKLQQELTFLLSFLASEDSLLSQLLLHSKDSGILDLAFVFLFRKWGIPLPEGVDLHTFLLSDKSSTTASTTTSGATSRSMLESLDFAKGIPNLTERELISRLMNLIQAEDVELGEACTRQIHLAKERDGARAVDPLENAADDVTRRVQENTVVDDVASSGNHQKKIKNDVNVEERVRTLARCCLTQTDAIRLLEGIRVEKLIASGTDGLSSTLQMVERVLLQESTGAPTSSSTSALKLPNPPDKDKEVLTPPEFGLPGSYTRERYASVALRDPFFAGKMRRDRLVVFRRFDEYPQSVHDSLLYLLGKGVYSGTATNTSKSSEAETRDNGEYVVDCFVDDSRHGTYNKDTDERTQSRLCQMLLESKEKGHSGVTLLGVEDSRPAIPNIRANTEHISKKSLLQQQRRYSFLVNFKKLLELLVPPLQVVDLLLEQHLALYGTSAVTLVRTFPSSWTRDYTMLAGATSDARQVENNLRYPFVQKAFGTVTRVLLSLARNRLWSRTRTRTRMYKDKGEQEGSRSTSRRAVEPATRVHFSATATEPTFEDMVHPAAGERRWLCGVKELAWNPFEMKCVPHHPLVVDYILRSQEHETARTSIGNNTDEQEQVDSNRVEVAPDGKTESAEPTVLGQRREKPYFHHPMGTKVYTQTECGKSELDQPGRSWNCGSLMSLTTRDGAQRKQVEATSTKLHSELLIEEEYFQLVALLSAIDERRGRRENANGRGVAGVFRFAEWGAHFGPWGTAAATIWARNGTTRPLSKGAVEQDVSTKTKMSLSTCSILFVQPGDLRELRENVALNRLRDEKCKTVRLEDRFIGDSRFLDHFGERFFANGTDALPEGRFADTRKDSTSWTSTSREPSITLLSPFGFRFSRSQCAASMSGLIVSVFMGSCVDYFGKAGLRWSKIFYPKA